jgi:hypothetical protein
MRRKRLPIEEIAKIAADIRKIEDFAENHGFDTSLVQATVNPGLVNSSSLDWPIISLIGFGILLGLLLSIPIFFEQITQKVANFIFVIGLLFVIGASVSAHKKFENNLITAVIGIGMLVALLVGGGVLTPREAADRLQEIPKLTQQY